MTQDRADNGDRNETPTEQADRNFGDLLQELRVSQTGVQFLFAFLLILAFQSRFAAIDTFASVVYVVTILCCAAATIFLIAPVAVHRAMFARRRKAEVVGVSARYAKVGLAFLALSMVGSLLLALDATVSWTWAALLSAIVGIAIVAVWFVHPKLLAGRAGDLRDGPPAT